MDTHTPTFESVEVPNSRIPQWYWTCSCGTMADSSNPIKEQVLLDFCRHEFPNAQEPDHTPTYYPDDFGATMWTCGCTATSRLGGHPQESRARQSHTRHTQQALLKWYAMYRAQAAKQAEYRNRDKRLMQRLRPDQRELLVQKRLEELL